MFKEIPASKKSFAKRKLIYGIGCNDSPYITQPTVDGRLLACPYYLKWRNMLKRCYSGKCQDNQPTYQGCSVSDEWLTFSNFKVWMQSQSWQDMQLDKDIKIKGNKVYSPKACLFIPHALNKLLTDSAAARGLYPIGVTFNKRSKRFSAQITYNGKKNHLGCFDTPEQASAAYQAVRKEKILKIISDDTYPMATQYLEQHI